MVELSESSGVAFLVVTHDTSMLHQFDVLTLAEGKLLSAAANDDEQSALAEAINEPSPGLIARMAGRMFLHGANGFARFWDLGVADWFGARRRHTDTGGQCDNGFDG